MTVLEISARQLPRIAIAVDADDEDVRAAVAGPADAVELVEEPREAARLAFLLVFFLVRLVGDTRGERDARRVGRPRDPLDAPPHVGQLARLPALRRADL